MVFGVFLLIGFFVVAVPKELYTIIFTGNKVMDPLLGALFGSVAIGNPIVSFVIGGELLKEGISLVAVTAFILTWISVGIVQLPAESLMLGKKFAITRNILNFFTALIISVLTVITLSVI